MSSTGKITEIVDIPVVKKQINTLIDGLENILDKVEKIAGAGQQIKFNFGNSKNLKDVVIAGNELEEQMKILNPLAKELSKIEEKRLALQAKLAVLESDQAKESARLAAETAKKNKELAAEARLNAEKVGSLSRLSAELAIAKKQYKELNDAERKSSAGTELLTKIQKLDEEIKGAEASLGEFQRRVGQYELAGKSLKGELKQIARELSVMKTQGLENSDTYNEMKNKLSGLVDVLQDSNTGMREQLMVMTETLAEMKRMGMEGTSAYEEVRLKVGELSDTLNDARAEVRNFASDTQRLDQLVSVAEGLTGAFSVLEGSTVILGLNSEELQKTFVRLQAAMTTLNGLKSIQNYLQKESAGYTLAENIQKKLGILLTHAQNKAETGGIFTRKAATIAQWMLNKAMAANPAGALLVTLGALVTIGWGLYKVFTSNAKAQEEFSKSIEHSKKSIENLNREVDRQTKFMQASGESESEVIKAKIKAAEEEFDIRKGIIDELILGYDKLTDEQKEQLKELQAAQKESLKKIADYNDEASVSFVKQQKEVSQIKLNLVKEGISKELGLLDFEYKEKLKMAEGNANLQSLYLLEQQHKETEIRKKYASEYLKLEQDTISKLNKARISLMDDGFEKELSDLRENYRQQIEELDNRLRDEENLTSAQRKRIQETRKVIIQKQNKDENELITQSELRGLKIRQEALQMQIETSIQGSQEQLKIKLDLLELQRQSEIIEAEKTGQSVYLINQKYAKESADLLLEASLASISKSNQQRLLAIDNQYQSERQALDQHLAESKISLEQYEKDKSALETKFDRQRFEEAIRIAAAEVEELKKSGLDTLAAEQKLNEARKALYESDFQNFKDGLLKKEEAQKELNSKLWELGQELNSSIMGLVNAGFDKKSQRLAEEAAMDEETKSKELERAGTNEALKEQINAKYEAKEKQREAEKRRIEGEKAKFEKLNALFSIALSTAKNVAMASNPLHAWMIPFIISTGLLQAAVVAARPLPKYFKGRKNGPAEFAWVGEQGTEAIKLPSGETYFTPDKPTITYLPEGASVIPNHDLFTEFGKIAIPDFNSSISQYSDYELQQIRFEISGLHAGFDMLANVVKNKKEFHVNITEKGIQTIAKHGQSWTEYLNKNVRI